MLLLKTHQDHMAGVRKNRKHATDAEPRYVKHGDFLLVQVTSGPPGNEVHRVRYAMRFDSCYEDKRGESQTIWGHQWRFIISGYDFRLLRRPFDIEDVKVTNTNYGQGAIRFVYVHPKDEEAIVAGGYLDGV